MISTRKVEDVIESNPFRIGC